MPSLSKSGPRRSSPRIPPGTCGWIGLPKGPRLSASPVGPPLARGRVPRRRRVGGMVAMPAPVPLSGRQIAPLLTQIPAWRRRGVQLRREFRFESFASALAFVAAVGGLAERVGHHPDIDIRYDRVTLGLTTHEIGGLTELDFALAVAVDLLPEGPLPAASRPHGGR